MMMMIMMMMMMMMMMMILMMTMMRKSFCLHHIKPCTCRVPYKVMQIELRNAGLSLMDCVIL